MPIKTNTKRSALTNKVNQIALSVPTVSEIGEITALIHNTRNILNIFDPTTLPIAISDFFFITATIEVVSSGNEVHNATILNHTRDCASQRTLEIANAPSTTHFHQIVKPINHTTI